MKSASIIVLILAVCAGCARAPQKQTGKSAATAWQTGITVADEPGNYNSDEALAVYANAKSLGVRWIGLTPAGFMYDIHKPQVRWREQQNIGDAIDAIHALGLAVTLKPYLWSGQFYRENTWTGEIEMQSESDWMTFFHQYDDFILNYARTAEQHHAELLCIGLELPKTLPRTVDWNNLIRQVRGVYHGMITYASAGIDEAKNVPFWVAMDFIGVDAYCSLSDKSSPTDQELYDGWKPFVKQLDSLSAAQGKKILFTEAGYRSCDGAACKPWEWAETNPHPVDVQLQARCYEALCKSFFSKPWFAGMYWWKYYATPTAGGLDDNDFTPQNKPAEKVIKKWYSAMDSLHAGNGLE